MLTKIVWILKVRAEVEVNHWYTFIQPRLISTVNVTGILKLYKCDFRQAAKRP